MTAIPVCFTHDEHLKLLGVVHIIRSAAIRTRNAPVASLMTALGNSLLDYCMDDLGTCVLLDPMVCSNLCLCMERYIKFCVERRLNAEYVTAVTIISKLTA